MGPGRRTSICLSLLPRMDCEAKMEMCIIKGVICEDDDGIMKVREGT